MMSLRLHAACMLTIIGLALAGGAFAVDIPPMPPLKTFYTEVPIAAGGAANCIIAHPPGDEYAVIARSVAEAIKAVSGADVPVKDAAGVSIEMMRSSNMILLGYFANNPLVNRIYDEHYVSLDSEWPAKSGYVVRTVHDPLGTGTCFVYLGGASVEPVQKAADAFIASLPEKGDIVYPHTVRILTGDGELLYKQNPGAIENRVKSGTGKQFRDAAGVISGAAADYYQTGNPDSVEVFKQLIPVFHAIIRPMKDIGDARGAFELFNMADNIEEAPGMTAEDRAAMTAMLWEFANKFRDANKEPVVPELPVGNDWDSRVTWDIARYFMKYYKMDVAGLWAWAEARFQGKAKFWRSNEDCPGYGGMTMYDMLYYALPAQYDTFFEDGTAKRMADYGMAVMNNLGGHAGFGDTSSMGAIGYWAGIFNVCAWKLKDGRYLYAYDHSPGGGRGNYSYNSYRQTEIEPVLPEDMLGIHVIPLPDWVYENREKMLGTAPSQMNPILDADPTPPYEECFDKIVFRTSFEKSDQYMIVGGISHGYHAHPDGNSIIEMTDNGRYCIFDSGYFVPDTVEHNTLVVYRDGLFEPIPRLTGLAVKADFHDLGMTQTYLNGYNGVDWRRNIIWSKENFFLVVDEVEAVEGGNYGLNAIFRTLSDKRPEIAGDRLCAFHKGTAFNIVSASQTPIGLTSTTPPSANRYAVVEAKSADMAVGDKQHFYNLLYTAPEQGAYPYEIVPAGDGAVMLKSPDGYALAGTGECKPGPSMIVNAATFHIAPDAFHLADGVTLTANITWFASDKPVNIGADLADGTGTIEAEENCVVRLYAKGDQIKLDGKAIPTRLDDQAVEFDVPVGAHTLSFTPGAQSIALGESWEQVWTQLQGRHQQALAGLTGGDGGEAQLQAAWKVDASRIETKTVYVDAAGDEIEQIMSRGRPMVWTEAQRGAGARDAFDGNPETYCATGSGAAWTSDLPKDLGMEWDAPVRVGTVEVDYYNAGYGPTDTGQDVQAWDGENWYSVEDTFTKDETGANWVHTFDPVETTRIRILVTEFNPSRTAVREMRIFPTAATPKQVEERVPFRTNGMATMDVDGDGAVEVLVAVGNLVRCIKGDGNVAWEVTLPKDALCIAAYDLDNDGKGEVVVGGADHMLYCYDFEGKERWSLLTPADPYFPEIEPATGPIRVVGCADIDADGDGEIVIGSGNWFAYGYDHQGNKLWGTLNWAHQPTSIVFVPQPDGKQWAFIGTTYNDANAFGPDGKKVAGVSVGYHGAAMSVTAGDMDGDGRNELIAGSRVGGVHCQGAEATTWTKFMGAEVTQVAMTDLGGDGKLELVAGSRNYHVLACDAAGTILWARNVGNAILDLLTADVNGDGTDEIIVATEGGMVRILNAAGEIISTMSVPDNVRTLVAGDLTGNGTISIAAGCDDGYVYGGVR